MVTTIELLRREGIAGREYRRRQLAAARPTPQQLMRKEEQRIEVEKTRIESERKEELEKEFKDIDRKTAVHEGRVMDIERQLRRPDLTSERKDRLQNALTEAEANITQLSRAKTLISQGYSPSSVRAYVESKISRLQQRQKFKAMQFRGEPLVAWKTPEGQVLYQSMDPSLAKAKGLTAVVVGFTGRGVMGFEELPQYRAEFAPVTAPPVTPESFKFPTPPSVIGPAPTTWEKVKRTLGFAKFQAEKRVGEVYVEPIQRLDIEVAERLREVPGAFAGITERVFVKPTKPFREYELTPEQKGVITPRGTSTGYIDPRGRFVPTPSPAEIPYTITPTTIQEVIATPAIIEKDIRPFIEKGVVRVGELAGLEPTVTIPERELTYREYVEDISKTKPIADVWKPTTQLTEEFRITEPITITEPERVRLTGLGIVAKGLGYAPMVAGYIYAPTAMLAGEAAYGATQYSNLDEITEKALTDQYELHIKEPVEEGYRHLTEEEFKSSYGTQIREEVKQGALLQTGVPLTILAGVGAYRTFRAFTKPRGVSTKILGTSKKVSPTLEGKQKVQTDILFETKTKTWFGTKTHVGVARSETVVSKLEKTGQTVTYGKFGQEGYVLGTGKFKVTGMKEFNVLTESVAKDATITAQFTREGLVSSANVKGFQEIFAGKVAVARVGRLDVAPTKTDFLGVGTGVPIIRTPKTELTVLFGKTIGIKKAKVVGVPSIYEGGIFSKLGATDDLFFMGDSGIPLTQIQRQVLAQAQAGISAAVIPKVTKAIPTVIPAVTAKPIIEIIKPVITEAPVSKIITPTIKPKPIKDILVVKPLPTKPTYAEMFEYVKPGENVFFGVGAEVGFRDLGVIEGRIPTGFLEPAMPKPPKIKPKVEPILAPIIKPKIKPKVEEKVRVIQVMKPKERLIERARVTPVTSLIPRAKAREIQRARVTPKVKQIPSLKVRQVPVTITPTITPWWFTPIRKRRRLRERVPRRPRRPRRRLPLEFGYRVEVRRRGRFIPEIPFAVPKGEALWLGRRAVKRGAAVTFKLKLVKEKPRKIGVPRITERVLAIEFRKPIRKGITVEEPLTFIQRRRYRIVTPGERREITMKGWAARRGRKERWM